jgi:hypothetical protein
MLSPKAALRMAFRTWIVLLVLARLAASFFLALVKGRKIRGWRRRKRRVLLQTAKPDHVTCFQSFTRKTSESTAKLSGNFTNAQTGAMLYVQQNAAITNSRRMAVSVLIKAVFEAAQARKRRKK